MTSHPMSSLCHVAELCFLQASSQTRDWYHLHTVGIFSCTYKFTSGLLME